MSVSTVVPTSTMSASQSSAFLVGQIFVRQNATTCLSLRQEHSSADGVAVLQPQTSGTRLHHSYTHHPLVVDSLELGLQELNYRKQSREACLVTARHHNGPRVVGRIGLGVRVSASFHNDPIYFALLLVLLLKLLNPHISLPFSDLSTGVRPTNALNINFFLLPTKYLQPVNLAILTI